MPRKKELIKDVAAQVKTQAKKDVEEKDTLIKKELVHTGATILNLACSDQGYGGFPLRRMVNVIGDSSSGKSILALSLIAEAVYSKRFKNHRVVYDDPEAAMSFDLSYLFGGELAEKMEAPGGQDEEGNPIYSDTIEDFQTHVHALIKEGRPFIYILDSLDALDSEDDKRQATKEMKAREAGKEVSGSYGMSKPKKLSQILRQVIRELDKTNSLLVIISQTRDDINPMTFSKKTRSGGRALKFYATLEIWMAVKEKIRRSGRVIGIICKAKITKNKLTGKIREVLFPIFYDYGVDDVGACIDFLIKEGVWRKTGQKIHTDAPFITATLSKLVSHIEENNLETDLRKLVTKTWRSIENKLKLNRKKKYGGR